MSSRSSTGWGWSLAGLAAGVLMGTVLYAPAHWVAAGVALASDGYVRIVGTRGTLWNGTGVLVLSSGNSGGGIQTLPTRLQWRLRPEWLGVRLELSSACCTEQPASLQLALSGISLEDAKVKLPLSMLQGLGTPWNTLGLRGDLTLQTADVKLLWRQPIQGGLDLTAERVSTSLSTLSEVGSYRVLLSGGATPQMQLSTLRGDLMVSGAGSWHRGQLRFRGEGEAKPESAAALVNLLTLLGDKQGNKTKIRLG